MKAFSEINAMPSFLGSTCLFNAVTTDCIGKYLVSKISNGNCLFTIIEQIEFRPCLLFDKMVESRISVQSSFLKDVLYRL